MRVDASKFGGGVKMQASELAEGLGSLSPFFLRQLEEGTACGQYWPPKFLIIILMRAG